MEIDLKYPFAAIFCGLHLLCAQAQTNALWLQTAVPPTNPMTPRQIVGFIESESAKLDPSGKGLTVLYHPGFDRWFGTEGGFAFSPTPISFYALLDAAASAFAYPQNSAKVFDDVGVVPWAQRRYVYTAIEGRCTDARTREPIANFRVEGGFLSPPLLAIQPDGYFVCGIQQKFDFSTCGTATFAEHDITDLKQTLTFMAPGYAPLTITNEVYRPGDRSGLRTYEIQLTPIDGDK